MQEEYSENTKKKKYQNNYTACKPTNAISKKPSLLQYEREILKKSTVSSLSIFSEGLNIHSLILRTIKFYLKPFALTFIINYNFHDFQYLIKNLQNECNFHYSNKIPTNSIHRTEYYKRGGVYLFNTTTLLTDLINNILEVEKITALIVLNAEKLKPTSKESFIINIFNSKNKEGIIKAYSEKPSVLANNLFTLHKLREILKIEEINFFPYFLNPIHEEYKKFVSVSKEIPLKLHHKLEEIEFYLLEIINKIIRETGKVFDFDSFKFTDVVFLKNIGFNYIEAELIYKYQMLLEMLFIDFEVFRFCYFQVKQEQSWGNSPEMRIIQQIIKSVEVNELSEMNKKLFILKEIINEFRQQNETERLEGIKKIRERRILVLCDNTFVASVLAEKHGQERRNPDLKRIYISCLEEYKDNSGEQQQGEYSTEPPNQQPIEQHDEYSTEASDKQTKKQQGEYSTGAPDEQSIEQYDEYSTGVSDKQTKQQQDEYSISQSDEYSLEQTYENHVKQLPKAPAKTKHKEIIFKTHAEFKYNETKYDLCILLSSRLSSMRLIKRQETNPTTVFYNNSFEEDRYLNELEMEKEAFKKLTKEHRKMPPLRNINKELNGLRVLIDCRELKSTLPFYLFQKGFEIQINMLEIGDYILNDSICIERKGIFDLMVSLKGRLYSQLKRMAYNFESCYLLIEFPNSKFSIFDYSIKRMKTEEFVEKFLVLIMFFNIKIIYSLNNQMTIKYLKQISHNQIINKEENLGNETAFDPKLLEIINSLPFKNIKAKLSKFKNLRQLLLADELQLKKVFGSLGSEIFSFFHSPFSETD
ncbi:DNA repair endonuclease XPF [Cucumispora dikerogammari]|nr:DNA repair endonuclease XPF [Cucumispora dikerogammari]